ncbi:hypothetical protein EP755_19310 [Salmonella enterica subsp. enterica serovar Kentucky]|nr:hypothetical protein [Salmonella enterica subsp. enterica serovar Kentucky]
MSVLFSLTLVFQFFRELLLDFWRFALSPIASFDVNAREALYNPHQAAIDVKKPAELVLCGLSELH